MKRPVNIGATRLGSVKQHRAERGDGANRMTL
jgi:hypothetical protein